MVTGGTYGKRHHFRGAERLTYLQNKMFEYAEQYGWQFQAWAIFSNHYHFVAISPENPDNLSGMMRDMHSETSREINEWDNTSERTVWYNFWDTQLTYQKSYLARLKYVHYNPVKHQLVDDPIAYRWCSASWFEQQASLAFQKTVRSFKTDKVNVIDSYEVATPS